ncbi:MAG: hypothetical protein KIT80_08605 [Chitinophagaceae bacterium]|nr:hypothetical protein [Chitinophagaceae bacterium]MCW5926956.1 hypothetical protein [Chitinophagaceae bacterium]
MQKRYRLCQIPLLFVFATTLLVSCGKESEPSIETVRKNNIATSWKIKDITLAYPIPFAGQTLPIGFSLFNVTGMLPISGPKIACTKEATYTFNPNYSYSINGCTDLIFPGAGQSGSWSLSLNGGILKLGNKPYMTTAMTEDTWTISNTVVIAEAGAAVPINIILEK